MTRPLSGVLQATAKLCLEQGVALKISTPGQMPCPAAGQISGDDCSVPPNTR